MSFSASLVSRGHRIPAESQHSSVSWCIAGRLPYPSCLSCKTNSMSWTESHRYSSRLMLPVIGGIRWRWETDSVVLWLFRIIADFNHCDLWLFTGIVFPAVASSTMNCTMRTAFPILDKRLIRWINLLICWCFVNFLTPLAIKFASEQAQISYLKEVPVSLVWFPNK